MTNAFTSPQLFGHLLHDPKIAAEFGPRAYTNRMLAFEAAWMKALVAHDVVSRQDADEALAAIEGYVTDDLGAGSDRDGLPVPAMVASLKAGLGKGAARAIHTGATSQDVMDTATMLTLLAVMDHLTVRLSSIILGLDKLSARFGTAPLMARTRMQAALPATANLRLDAWRRPLADHLERADALRADLVVVQIGGPIGMLDTPNNHVERCAQHVADTLGLTLAPVWHTDRSRIVAFGHWLTLVSGTLGKLGQDIALMAQQGIAEIALSDGGGSSAMAHKQNPVAAELLVALARYTTGQQSILAQAMIHEQERSGAAWALEWLTVPAMAEATGAALRHAETLIGNIERIGGEC